MSGQATEPIIDIHQHQHYKGRADEVLLAHQRAMGVPTTVILPSARAFDRLDNARREDPGQALQRLDDRPVGGGHVVPMR